MKHFVSVAGLVISCAGSALAVPMIAVDVNGQRQPVLFASGQTVTVNLDGDPSTPELEPLWQDVLVRIYEVDSAGTPQSPPAVTAAIGKVVVNGSLGQFNRLRLLVSGAYRKTPTGDGPGEAFPATIRDPISVAGAAAFGLGSNPADRGLVFSDPQLANQTRLAIAVTNEVAGDITVGQIERVQADGGNPRLLTAIALR